MLETRAVKMSEKLNSNFVPKYDQNWNYISLKGIISVSFVFSLDATRGRIEQNMTNLQFFRA